MSDALEILSSGGLVRLDVLLLRFVWIMSFGLGQGRSLVSWGCARQLKYQVKYIHHIKRGFGSRD